MAGTEKRYWFAKREKWNDGWAPVTWQGWTAMIVFIALLVGGMQGLAGTVAREYGMWPVGLAVALAWGAALLIGHAILMRFKRDPDRTEADYRRMRASHAPTARAEPQ